jgi:hypothetical protein
MISHKDVQSLILKYKDGNQEKRLIIYNIYNPSLSSYSILEEDSLTIFRNQLQ